MTRFLANIMDMTRLESGEIAPRIAAVALADVVDAAIARLEAGNVLGVDLPDALPACGRPGAAGAGAGERAGQRGEILAAAGSVCACPAGSPATRRVVGRRRGHRHPADDLPHVFDSFYRVRREDRTGPAPGWASPSRAA